MSIDGEPVEPPGVVRASPEKEGVINKAMDVFYSFVDDTKKVQSRGKYDLDGVNRKHGRLSTIVNSAGVKEPGVSDTRAFLESLSAPVNTGLRLIEEGLNSIGKVNNEITAEIREQLVVAAVSKNSDKAKKALDVAISNFRKVIRMTEEILKNESSRASVIRDEVSESRNRYRTIHMRHSERTLGSSDTFTAQFRRTLGSVSTAWSDYAKTAATRGNGFTRTAEERLESFSNIARQVIGGAGERGVESE